MTGALVAARLPSGPAFTVVLVCHVAAVLVGIVAVVATGVSAARVLAARGGAPGPSVRGYFAPGVNWAGRVLYLIPVFGGALVAMSGGAYPLGVGWVLGGIGLWTAAMALAEGVLWPAERRAQRAIAAIPSGAGIAASVPGEALQACRAVVLSAGAVLVIVVTAMVVMFAKP